MAQAFYLELPLAGGFKVFSEFYRSKNIGLEVRPEVRPIEVSENTEKLINDQNGHIFVSSLDEVRMLGPREKPTLKLRRSPMPFTAIQNTSNASFATMSNRDLVDLINTATNELCRRIQ